MPVATHTEEDQTPEMSMRSKRSLGEDAVPVPSHENRNVPADFRSVNGWGADLDPKNRPSFPKEWPSDVKSARGEVKDWQVPHEKIHVSNEHPNLTPVFGTACPPRGLSGMLRDYAYEFGEATNRHWMTLMLADRIDIYGSMILDVFRGKGDNIVREKAWSARLQNAKPDDAKTLAMAGAVAVGVLTVAALLVAKRRR